MNSLEVRAWPRKGSPPQLALNVNCETEVYLTPEQADTLADRLKWSAQFVRHHVKRQRGDGEPMRHVTFQDMAPTAASPAEPCPFFLAGDVTFQHGAEVADGARGSTFTQCKHCHGQL